LKIKLKKESFLIFGKMNFKFKYKKRSIQLKNVKECKSIFSKATGLMFRKHSKPLLFYFNQSCREPIHSFFCVPFVAVWFNKNKIIDAKIVFPGKPFIRPLKKFDQLLEIPVNDKQFNLFYRGVRKI
jgi:uncharacterized membrane protein (UPF0127 family)